MFTHNKSYGTIACSLYEVNIDFVLCVTNLIM